MKCSFHCSDSIFKVNSFLTTPNVFQKGNLLLSVSACTWTGQGLKIQILIEESKVSTGELLSCSKKTCSFEKQVELAYCISLLKCIGTFSIFLETATRDLRCFLQLPYSCKCVIFYLSKLDTITRDMFNPIINRYQNFNLSAGASL